MATERPSSESVIDEQQRRWASGDRVPVERLVKEHESLAAQPDVVLDLIYGEILLREDDGERPEQADYCRRFPHLEAAIARQFQVHRALQSDHALGSTGPVAGTTVAVGNSYHEPGAIRIPGFQVLEVVGRGGSGIVYRARDTSLNRHVVIKLLLGGDIQTETHRLQLRREAEAAAALHHAGIVQVHQVGEVKSSPFLVMEFLEGGSLAERLRHGPLQVDEAVELVKRVAEAIQHAHDHGVIHRDIKPGNVLLDKEGKPQVGDFGLARRLDAEHTLHATGDVVGTPAYMAPEQARGESADERSDVYALGALLYESLCGRSPFQAATPWEILNQVLTNDAVPLRQLNPSLPKDLETICAKCLEKDSNRRYPSAQAVADELQNVQSGRPIQARPVSLIQRCLKWCRRNKRVAGLATTSIALLLFLGIGSAIAALRLSSANKSIQQEQQKAATAENVAIQDRTAAINALNRLVDSLYDDLSRNAATIKTRQKVVDAAIDGLKSIAHVDNDRIADRTTMKAYQRIGELMSLQGKNKQSAEYFNQGIDYAREAIQRRPDDIDAQRDLALSLGMLSVHYTRINQMDGTQALADESESILRKVLERSPDDIEALKQLVIFRQQQFDVRWRDSKNNESIVELSNEALSDVHRLIEMADDSSVAHNAAQAIHFRVGRSYLELGDVASAASHFADARTHLNLALNQQPNDPNLKSASAVLDRAHAMVKLSQGEMAESALLFEQSLKSFEALATLDPENSHQRQQVANTQSLRSNVLHALGQYQQAIDSTADAIRIYVEILAASADDATTRILIAESYFKKANSQLGLNDWAAAGESYDQVVRYLAGPEFGKPVTGGTAIQYLMMTEMIKEGLARLEEIPVKKKTSTGECIALMLAARKAAFATNEPKLPGEAIGRLSAVNSAAGITTFDDLFRQMHGLQEVNPIFAAQRKFFEARVYAIQARHLSESDQPADKQASAELVGQSVTALKEFTTLMPGGSGMIASEPDLTWLTKTDSFQSLATPPPNQ